MDWRKLIWLPIVRNKSIVPGALAVAPEESAEAPPTAGAGPMIFESVSVKLAAGAALNALLLCAAPWDNSPF